MKIYCKNYECQFNKKLEEPYQFKYSKIYTPFEDDKCRGECTIEPILTTFEEENKDFKYEVCQCGVQSDVRHLCTKTDCTHNEAMQCTRLEILIDKHTPTNKWICKCYAHSKFKGHMDWFSRFCNSDGTAKGGSIDDEYAKKMDKWQKTTRSYKTHMKQV